MSGLRDIGPRHRGIGPRRVTWRAMLSALAGGGLTMAGLGGPLAGGALGAEAPTSSTTTGEGAEPPVTSTTPETGTSTTGSTQSTTSTPTTPAPATAPSSTSRLRRDDRAVDPGPEPRSGPAAGEAPAVIVRHKQRATPSRPASASLTQTQAKPTGGGSAKSVNTPASAPRMRRPGLQQRGAAAAARGRPGRALAAMLGGSAASRRRSTSTASRCSCCRSTRPRRSSTACRGRFSPRSTKSRPTTAPTCPCRAPAPRGGCSSCPQRGCSTAWTRLTRATPTPTTRSTRSSPPRAT